MATDHRGRPTGDNHRSYPRIEAMLRRELGRSGITNTESSPLSIVRAHQTGEPRKGTSNGKVKTGPVYTDLYPYVGYKEYREAMDNIPWTPYDSGVDDALDADVAARNQPYEVNTVVREAGGTGAFIARAFKNRHKDDPDNEEL